MSAMRPAGSEEAPLDVAGIGLGPSNLSLAVYAREIATDKRCLYFERNPRISWHPGMLLDGARMQISFLKDLVTLRNPSSPYSFLQYLKARGRLEHFVNLGQFRATRLEYDDYLRWVATSFSDQVRYNSLVRRVTPVAAADGNHLASFRLEIEDTRSGELASIYARNVVYGAGGRPRIPGGVAVRPPGVIHSSEFLQHFPAAFADRDRSYTFAVVGRGQSAGEIVEYLLDHYQNANVHLIISGYAPRPTDNSPFVNEQFFSERVDAFYRYDAATRAALLQELRDANYGVIHEEVLDRLYNAAYLDSVKGRQRLFVHSCSRLSSVIEPDDSLLVGIEHRFNGSYETFQSDALILATGYDRSLDPAVFSEFLHLADKDGSDGIMLSRNCRVRTASRSGGGVYVQGYGESLFGIGDTLLSLLPFRSKEIFDDICAQAPSDERVQTTPARHVSGPDERAVATTYPPAMHVEQDPDKLHQLMERFPFATVITASGLEEPAATQVPLILERSRGAKGVLLGHMDRSNPQADLIDGRRLLVLFSEPNGSQRPSVAADSQLPASNLIAIQARGRAQVLDRAASVRGLCAMTARFDPDSRLTADDPRVDELTNLVVGFEIEIDELTGTFDVSRRERELANLDLSRR
jgi:L-ornithine N5-oxygenase